MEQLIEVVAINKISWDNKLLCISNSLFAHPHPEVNKSMCNVVYTLSEMRADLF